MPILKSAKKALRQSERRRIRNLKTKEELRQILKQYQKLAKSDKSAAAELFSKVQKALDKATKTGIIKKNASSRKKSRLSKLTV